MNTRHKKMQELLIKQDIGVAIFFRPDEVLMMTGYLPGWGLSFYLVFRNNYKVLLIPEYEPGDILPGEIDIIRYPWGIMGVDPWKELTTQLIRLLKAQAVDHLPVTFIKNASQSGHALFCGEQPPLPGDIDSLLAATSKEGFKNIDNDLLELYHCKTREDLASLQLVNEISDIGIEVFYKNLTEGLTEAQLSSKIESEIQNQIGCHHGVRYAKSWAQIQSGVNTADSGFFNRSTGKIIRKNEPVLLEMATCVNGYYSDITRTGVVGDPSSLLSDIHHIVYEAQQKAVNILEPGRPISEIDYAARSYISHKGFGEYFNHALGHQLGFRYHDPGPSIVPRNNSLLKEGMTISIEPGIYGKDLRMGCRIEDNYYISTTGVIRLSKASINLSGN